MRWVLWLNTIAETLIAVGMFSVPGSFFPGAVGQAAAIARIFSFAILAVAFISFAVTPRGTSTETVKAAVTILLVYHVLQLIAQFVSAGIYPPLLIPPVIIHTVFSSLFAAYLVRLRTSS